MNDASSPRDRRERTIALDIETAKRLDRFREERNREEPGLRLSRTASARLLICAALDGKAR